MPFLVPARLKSRKDKNANELMPNFPWALLSQDLQNLGQTAQAIFNRLHFIRINRLHCFLLSLTVMAIHSDLCSHKQHWQNWQRSCSSYSTLLTHLRLPCAIIQHPRSIIGLLTPISLAPGAWASSLRPRRRVPLHIPSSTSWVHLFSFLLQEAGSGHFQLQVLQE